METEIRHAAARQTHAWLDEQIVADLQSERDPADFVYDDAGNPRRLSRYLFENLQRKVKIFRRLDRLRFESFLDVGASWDSYPYLARSRYGAEAYYADMVHRVNLPLGDPRYGRLDHAVTLDLTRLPFRDESFDVVLSSEVLEHLVRPIEAIAELLRITRKCLVMTSLEALSPSRLRRFLSELRVDTRAPHVERNFFLLEEIEAIFGEGLQHECLIDTDRSPVSPFAPLDEQLSAFAAFDDRSQLAAALARAVAGGAHGSSTMGILLLKTKDGGGIPSPEPAEDAAIADWLIGEAAATERSTWLSMAIGEVLRHKPELAPKDIVPERPVAESLLRLLQCPDCRAALRRGETGLICDGCGRRFPSEYGVPILHPGSFDEAAAAEEALARICGSDERRRQTVGAVLRRLRARESPPGVLRRALWKILPAPDSNVEAVMKRR